MALSTGEMLGAALLVGSVGTVAVLIGLILIGVDTIWALWDSGIDLIYEVAGAVRRALFDIE